MPFTFSHPAIILPLTCLPKKWFSLTGLIIGSLTPDFEYFIRMKIKSNYSHTIEGLFWFDLPLGIILTFLFHNLVRDQLFKNLHKFLKSRFSSFDQINWNQHFKKNWIIICLSILIGAASHLFWDSFTHDHGYFVDAIPFLSSSIEVFRFQIPVLKLLQHSSTLIGGLVIFIVVLKLPQTKIENTRINFTYWLMILGMISVIVILKFIMGLELAKFGNVIVTIISAFMIALMLTSLKFKKNNTQSLSRWFHHFF